MSSQHYLGLPAWPHRVDGSGGVEPLGSVYPIACPQQHVPDQTLTVQAGNWHCQDGNRLSNVRRGEDFMGCF